MNITHIKDDYQGIVSQTSKTGQPGHNITKQQTGFPGHNITSIKEKNTRTQCNTHQRQEYKDTTSHKSTDMNKCKDATSQTKKPQTQIVVVRPSEKNEDHLIILGLGLGLVSVGLKMAGEANLRLKASQAVRAGNGGCCWGSVCTVLPRLSALFSCCCPVGFTGFCALVNRCSCWCVDAKTFNETVSL